MDQEIVREELLLLPWAGMYWGRQNRETCAGSVWIWLIFKTIADVLVTLGNIEIALTELIHTGYLAIGSSNKAGGSTVVVGGSLCEGSAETSAELGWLSYLQLFS